MRRDVVELARFYTSPMGVAARNMVTRRMVALWPDARGCDVLGLGYALPFLRPYREGARRVVAAMPASQGVELWPGDGAPTASLVDEDALPFVDAVFDRVIAAHMVEEATSLAGVLREVWRVSAPEARVIIIAASRRGMWSRMETSPFGHGRPFTQGQLARVLRDAMLEPVAWARALYAPPIAWGPIARGAAAWESVGERLWPKLGGIIMVEAVKRVIAETPRARRRLVLSPAPAGVGQPAHHGANRTRGQGEG